MSGPWEDFGGGSAPGPWDDFGPRVKQDPRIGQPEDLTFAEKYLAPLLDKAGTALQGDPGVIGSASRAVLNNGNLRGSALGGAMQGAADPGIAIAQIAGNVVGDGEATNQAVRDKEAEYQAARKQDGRSGFDAARLVGNTLITAPFALGSGVVKGAVTGAGFGAAQPVTQGNNFFVDKAKQAALGAVGGAVLSPVSGLLARIVSPNASTNPSLQLLRDEGVNPTIGQTLGGWANALEQKAQSVFPLAGSMIQRARQAAGNDLQDAAYARVGDPIGATIEGRGNAGIAEASDKLGQEYERVLPKLSVNVLDQPFVDRISNLRGMVQNLPDKEAQQFDNVISREIDGRISPDGMLSGQNLKDAWNSLRNYGSQFSKSTDAYQAQLGQAFKQAFQELKDHVTATNAAPDVAALKNVDLGYANFKRIQRAAGSLGADGGNFSPAQLQNSVKALDSSKDKARFAEGDALMQDLSSAGKSVLGSTVPDSGTAGRLIVGGILGGGGLFAPHISIPAIAGMGLAGAAYTRPVQNALAALVANRPDIAPEVANALRAYLPRMSPALAAFENRDR